METNIVNAFNLLLVGMFTVFFILFIVVTSGQILIRVVNQMNFPAPGMEFIKAKKSEITSDKIAAITATVEIITKGQGTIVKIEKVK